VSFEIPTYDDTAGQLAAMAANRAPDLAVTPTEFMGELVGAQAQLAQGQLETAQRCAYDAVPSAQTSTDGLDGWAEAAGLSNGAGGFGRRGATAASGITVMLGGSPGETIPLGQAALAGGAQFLLSAAVTLPGTLGNPGFSQKEGSFAADPADPGSLGVIGNLLEGTTLTLVSPPANIDSTATVTAGPTSPGKDREDDTALLARLFGKLQRPPNGGDPADYEGWVTENIGADGQRILASGSMSCFVFPGYYGVLSPLLVVTLAGSGTARVPSVATLNALRLAINGSTATATPGKRPIGQDAVVMAPSMPTGRALEVNLQYIAAAVKYRPDWSRGGVGLTVSSFSIAGLPAWATGAGATAVLELNQLAPASLKAAISNGQKPHIFGNWVTTGGVALGPVTPEQVQVVAWNDTGVQTSLGLLLVAPGPTPALWATYVQVNNLIYPGGPAVAPICAAVISLTDSLGPSRITGLADPGRYWSDTLGINAIAAVAAGVLDKDGVTRMVDRCVANSISIRPADGNTQTVDLQAADNTVDGPECLYVGRVVPADG